MLAILVIFCPPLAVLLTTPSLAAKNFFLTLLGYVPGVLHARSVVEQYQVNRRYDSLMRLLEEREAPKNATPRAA